MRPASRTFLLVTLHVGAFVLFAAAAFGGWWFYESYWRYRECIDENLRGGGNGCYVEEIGTVLSGNAAFLIVPALILLLLAVFLELVAWEVSRRGRRKG